MRAEYLTGELHRRDLHPDPLRQFGAWFDDACKAGLLEPNAMSLATVSSHGQPSVRTVLLKGYNETGFQFFTNLESRKAGDMAANPRVALLFPWLPLQRQVSIRGDVERLPTDAAVEYFATRPRGSQLAAWISRQSSVVASRDELEAEWQKMEQRFATGEISLPPFWGGYKVVPREMEFWQGRANRLHDRFLYTRRPGNHWQLERLAP